MSKPLFIIGTGGLAREVAWVIQDINRADHRWDLRGFIGSDPTEAGRDLGYAHVVGDDAWLIREGQEADLIVGVGRPDIRRRIADTYTSHGDRFTFPNIIHPTALIDHDRVAFGRGNIVQAGCIFTCDISVGDFNLFNAYTTVGHDARVGSYSVFNVVNVSGGAVIEDGVLLGVGSRVLEGVRLGSGSTVGAGALVTKDVEPMVTVVGIPAKPFSRST